MTELVRDNIPKVLIEKGLNPCYEMLPEKHPMRKQYAREKLVNNLGELDTALRLNDKDAILQGLAKSLDLLAIVAQENGISMKQVREARDHKRALKGKHDSFVILKHSDMPLQ